MHVHIAASLNLDCVVVSSHSCHVQITRSSFNDWSMRKAVSIVLACHRQLHCCASAAHLPLLLVLVGYIFADNVMQCLQPTPVLSGFP